MNCIYCASENTIKRGFTSAGHQRYFCKDCVRWFNSASATDTIKEDAKILVFDIETSPIQVYVWSLLQHGYINPDGLLKDWFVISWAAKWLGTNEVFSSVLTSREAKIGDDKRVVRSIWELFNEADVVIAHNGDRFDIKKLNVRFLLHGMQPPLPYASIDTLKSARRVFGFTSNALNFLTQQLSLGQKLSTNFQLWLDCMRGDIESLSKMLKYNIMDIEILEEMYLAIRHWIPNHPNINLLVTTDDKPRCPVCGGLVTLSGKKALTPSNAWKSYRCTECKHTGRTKISALTKKERANIITR